MWEQRSPLLLQVAGPHHGEGAPADADHGRVVEQQAVELDRRDLTAGEADVSMGRGDVAASSASW